MILNPQLYLLSTHILFNSLQALKAISYKSYSIFGDYIPYAKIFEAEKGFSESLK